MLLAISPFKTPEFRLLFKEWNKKLEDSGFQDAEDFSLPDPPLKTWHSHKWDDEAAQNRKSSTTRYFELANDLLFNGFDFKNDLHRRVWELHCAGLSVRKIEHSLYSQLIGYRGRRRNNIQYIIQKIQTKSGLKDE